MKVRNPAARRIDAVLVDALTAYIADNPDADFSDILREVPEFAGLADGHVHQSALDAGFEVIP